MLLKTVHVWVGYVFAANLAVRLAWAFTGSPFGRWRALLPAGYGYLRSLREYAAGLATGNGADGGDAIASINLSAISGGVGANSSAFGGQAGGSFGTSGNAGDASATTIAAGPGDVTATSGAYAGARSDLAVRTGAANSVSEATTTGVGQYATAYGIGLSGEVGAQATSGGGVVTTARAIAIGDVPDEDVPDGAQSGIYATARSTTANVRNIFGSDGFFTPGLNSYVTGLPDGASMSGFLAGNPNAAALMAPPLFAGDPAALADPLFYGVAGAGYAGEDGANPLLINTVGMEFSIDVSGLADNQAIYLVLLDPASSGSGFDSLRLQILREGSSWISRRAASGTLHVAVLRRRAPLKF